MDRRTALFAFPSVLSSLAIARQPALDHSSFERCYQRYVEARAVAEEFMAIDEDDTDDQVGCEVFSRLSQAAKALICEPAPTLDALNKKLGCFYTEEMYLGTTFGKQAAFTLANDSRRLVGVQELEPVDFDDPTDDDEYWEGLCGPRPDDPHFSADELAEHVFHRAYSMFGAAWRVHPFTDYELINPTLYAVYTVAVDRSHIAEVGLLMESAMDDHGARCWGVGKYGGDVDGGYAWSTVLFFEATSFEAIKDRFRINRPTFLNEIALASSPEW